MSCKLGGLYRGTVSDTHDPLNQSRLRAFLPQQLGKTTQTGWARPCFSQLEAQQLVFQSATPQATPQAFLPSVGAPVWIMFEGGDVNYPVWIGTWIVPGLPQLPAPIPPFPAIPQPSNVIVGPDAFGASSSLGTSLFYARQDHDHGLPPSPHPSPTAAFRTAASNVSYAGGVVPWNAPAAGDDPSGGWDSVNKKWVVPVSGWYRIGFSVTLSPGTAALNRQASLRVNGSAGPPGCISNENSTNTQSWAAEGLRRLNGGDGIDVTTSAPASSTLTGDSRYIYFNAVWVSA